MSDETTLELLLIEDTEADALLIRRRLEQAGMNARIHRVDRTESVVEAMEAQMWDAVLYDYTLPGMHFADTVELLRSKRPELPVILVSGTVSEELAINLLNHGLSDFVLKDSLLRLPGVIRRAVDNAGERTRRQAAEDQLRKLAMVVEQSPTSIIITDTTPAIEYVNKAFVETTGYSREEVLGRNPSILNRGQTPPTTYAELWATIAQGVVWKGEFRNTRKNGSTYLEMATIAPIRQPDGRITHYVAVKTDITELRDSEARIHRLINFDDLTGLPNRALLLDRLRQVGLTVQRSGQHGVILVLDVDGFKFINDMHGYQAGNCVLSSIAARLTANLPEHSIIGRIGANRFAVVIEDLSRQHERAAAQAHDLAELLHEQLQEPHLVDGVDGSVRHATTMGLYLITREREKPDRLLNKAEIALQRARDDSRNTWQFFNPEMQSLVEQRSHLEAGLHQALENREFRLFFQSQFDADGKLTGAEALLRWFRPDGEIVPPDHFIPLAEDTGLILPIGEWVLEVACRQLREWSTHPETSGLSLAVNISARQFHQPNFIESLARKLKAFKVTADHLVLELTESVVLNNLLEAEERMRAIRDLGVRLALDDFGTGFSSLAYLQHLPFHILKIDRSFVSNMTSDNSSAAIVRATIAMGHALDLKVTAEGVEVQEELDLLRRFGCDAYQGFLFARPVAAENWTPTGAKLA
ncbi:MAG: EAL domain-containing protein [Wenzhouxiangella sp.]|nr:MAG: EAL domain-containing protein [Wenzhouxiangella sp.]